jgi:hypothetical protein
MGPISYDKVEFKIGDLVEFRGYNYSPDYYYNTDDESNHMLGIVIDHVTTIGPYITKVWLYKVYWFRTKKVTETVGGHLKIVLMQKV